MSFTLTNGESFEITDTRKLAKNLKPEHQGKFLPVLIHKKYDDGTEQGSLELEDDLKDNPTTILNKTVIDTKTDKVQNLAMTCLLAKNQDYVDYPSVDNYMELGFASNCEYKHTVELMFKSKELTQRMFVEWNGPFSFADFINGVFDETPEEIKNGKFENQGFRFNPSFNVYHVIMYDDFGELIEIDLDEVELLNSLMSIRVIEFNESIID